LFKTFQAYLVHLFTVSGIVFSFIALLYAVDKNLPMVFFYLALALFVDGIDGSLARKVNVKKYTPLINGEILDNIIDFLNYVFIPAFVIYWFEFVPKGLEILMASLILVVSCYTFANNNVKTSDFYFSGFPALWNVVILYFYLLDTSHLVNLIVIILLTILTFIPFKYLHPFRVVQLRKTSLFILLLWMISTVIMLYYPSSFTTVTLKTVNAIWILSNLYFLAITVTRTLREPS
jgi:phosphatidylcholine synthase